MVVGTHALIQEGVRFHDLRLAVVDEQHRFGVAAAGRHHCRRGRQGEGIWPHTLHMSATPIPRTLSLTLYGDLDVSVLDEMPPGRRPVRTRLVFADSEARMWEFVRAELARGRQAYVVCPLIEESETLQTASARRTFEDLGAGELAGFRLRLLHGQLPAAEKAAAMAAYAAGEADVLVSTSVIEVGVDVANATVMVIMGRSTLRTVATAPVAGSGGPGSPGIALLPLVEGEDEAVLERLALFARTTDGFELAEADLAGRGEGQLFGERQSGLGDLEVASLLRDSELLEEARMEAEALLAKLETANSRPRCVCCLRPRKPGSPTRSRGWRGRERGPPSGRLRIVAGTRRGKCIKVPRGEGLQANQRKGARGDLRCSSVRLGALSVLDLFAGTGALGLEALSRGARSCVFVENDPEWPPRSCARTSVALGYEPSARVIGDRLSRAPSMAWPRREQAFDLLFVDPPYRMLAEVEVLLTPLLPSVMSVDGVAGHRG